MRRTTSLFLVSLPLVLGLIVACGSRTRRDGFGDGTGVDSGVGFASDAGGGCTECSADLHDIVTCGDNPTVIESCPEGQGCTPTGCEDACAAAAAR